MEADEGDDYTHIPVSWIFKMLHQSKKLFFGSLVQYVFGIQSLFLRHESHDLYDVEIVLAQT